MQDLITKGTGNSRFLKSVENFKALYPTYDAFVNALVAGNLPVDFNGLNPAGIEQVGTPINTSSLLTDATAEYLGLKGSGFTVNDALRVAGISVFSKHLWSVYSGGEPSVSEVVVSDLALTKGGSHGEIAATWEYSSYYKIYVDVGGTVHLVLVEPSSITVKNSSNDTYKATLAGKYCTCNLWPGYMIFIPEDTTIKQTSSVSYAVDGTPIGGPWALCATTAYRLDLSISSLVFDHNEQAFEPTAYPQNGYEGGFWYVYRGFAGDLFHTPTKSAAGGYRGTGVYGSSNPNTLTFDFEPKLVVVHRGYMQPYTGYWQNGFVWTVGMNGTYVGGTGSNGYITFSLSGNTLSWYHANNAGNQLNSDVIDYYYMAIG